MSADLLFHGEAIYLNVPFSPSYYDIGILIFTSLIVNRDAVFDIFL